MPDFSSQSGLYARFRPRYPEELFEFIYKQLQTFDRAWDVGTGNGQFAIQLASKFREVIASDTSQRQLQEAELSPNVTYVNEPAEKTSIESNSVDLVSVAQAVHWFNFPEFYAEVKRVKKPDGLIVLAGYGMFRSIPELDEIISELYQKTTGPYWDPRRKYLDEDYKTIPFPFEEIECPQFNNTVQWNWKELSGYLRTWSAVQEFIRVNGHNPIDKIDLKIKEIVGVDTVDITFPLLLRVGK